MIKEGCNSPCPSHLVVCKSVLIFGTFLHTDTLNIPNTTTSTYLYKPPGTLWLGSKDYVNFMHATATNVPRKVTAAP